MAYLDIVFTTMCITTMERGVRRIWRRWCVHKRGRQWV